MKHLTQISIITLALCCACTEKNAYDANGSFEATEIVVSSQASGQILEFNAEEGQELRSGSVIAVIDTLQLHLQKKQIEAQIQSILSSRPDIESQLSSLRSQITKQKSEKARIEKLIAKGAAPKKQLDDIEAQIEILQNQLDAQLSSLSKNSSAIAHNAASLSAQLELIEDRITRSQVITPADGTVIAKYANAGELANMGSPMVKLADLSTMYLRAYFTSEQLSELKLGDEVEVIADYGADKQYSYKGKISWISSESEFTPKAIQTRNSRANLVYAVKIAVENDGRIKLGMYGSVKL